MVVRYEIRAGDDTPCKLVSIVTTKFGGDAENFVCAGTHNYCQSIKDKLEANKDDT